MTEQLYWIWSIGNGGWWKRRPNGQIEFGGYTKDINQAGRFEGCAITLSKNGGLSVDSVVIPCSALSASPTKTDDQESSPSPQSHSPKRDSIEARIQNLEEFLGGLASRLQLTLKHPLVWHQSHSPLEGCLLSLLINIQHHAQNTLEKMDATTEEKTDQNHSGDQDHQGEHQEESEEFRDLAKKVGLVEDYLSDNPMYVRPKK